MGYRQSATEETVKSKLYQVVLLKNEAFFWIVFWKPFS